MFTAASCRSPIFPVSERTPAVSETFRPDNTEQLRDVLAWAVSESKRLEIAGQTDSLSQLEKRDW